MYWWSTKVPNRLNLKRSIMRNIIAKLSEVEDKENFESSQGKITSQIQRNPHKTISRFLSRNLTGQEKMEWYIQNAERNELLYPTKLSFKTKGVVKTFLGKQKLNRFITTRLALEEVIKWVLQVETKLLNNNMKPYEIINCTGKYIGKQRIM